MFRIALFCVLPYNATQYNNVIARNFYNAREDRLNEQKIILTLVLVILVLQTNFAGSQVVREGLVSYWSFDVEDVKGNTVLTYSPR